MPAAEDSIGEDAEIPGSDDEGAGILEQLLQGEDAQEKAVALLKQVGEKMNAINERVESTGAEIKAASARGQGVKAVLTLTNRLAKEITQSSDELSQVGREYFQVLGKLDPAIQIRFDAIEEQGPSRAG